MQLLEREFAKILKFYHVDNLGLVFDGFEWINPDKILYYWHNPKNGDLYVIELADYVHEFIGSKPFDRIADDYWPEHTCDWEVDYWIPHNKVTDCTDLNDWFYWPECGDKCVFAKLKANVSALAGRTLECNIPDISVEKMTKYREQHLRSIKVDEQRQLFDPSDQRFNSTNHHV